jgi:RNA polymerase sigma factor (sigma-70 family)
MHGQIPLLRSDPSDLALLQAMAAGHAPALDELYARYGSAVFGYLMARLGERQLAEEVLQDVMLAVWRSAASFRGDSKVLTWLLTIAHNRAVNARRRRTFTLVPFNDALDTASDDTGPLDRIVRQAERRAVREMLDRLPVQQREVLVLVFYHQLSAAEAARVLGVAIGTVKSRLHRAKAALRSVLESETNS